MRANEQHNTN